MEFQEEFKFLNLKVVDRKNAEKLKEDERKFLKLNLLDKNNNPCSFMVFKKDIMEKILKITFVGLQVLEIQFELVYNNNMWNVRLVDIHE